VAGDDRVERVSLAAVPQDHPSAEIGASTPRGASSMMARA
jgi:hypothetical protein